MVFSCDVAPYVSGGNLLVVALCLSSLPESAERFQRRGHFCRVRANVRIARAPEPIFLCWCHKAACENLNFKNYPTRLPNDPRGDGYEQSTSPSENRDWRVLYKAAIFETNRNAIPKLVSEAERAELVRGRELFRQTGTIDEKESLEDALYALRAYKSAWAHTKAA